MELPRLTLRRIAAACGFAVLVGFVVGFAAIVLDRFAASEDATPAAVIETESPFIYSFNAPGTLYETDRPGDSASPYWWVDSGAELVIADGVGATVEGSLPPGDKWRNLYAKTNPTDTDDGTHPQNIFRLLTKLPWENLTERADFYIANDELSSSPNRNESNGLLLMSRYRDDGQTLYYAGIRVDGTAVIKKKYEGTYYTMAQAQIFPGTYDAAAPVAATGTSADLLPHGEWVALQSTTVTNPDGSVTLTLSMELPGGAWAPLLSATDTGKDYGGTPPIAGSSPAGIRTDFMDVRFRDFEISAP